MIYLQLTNQVALFYIAYCTYLDFLQLKISKETTHYIQSVYQLGGLDSPINAVTLSNGVLLHGKFIKCREQSKSWCV